MDIFVKLLEAVSWPIAVMVTAFVTLAIVRTITHKSGKVGFKWKDYFSFEADASRQLGDAAASPVMSPSLIAPPHGEPLHVEPDVPIEAPAGGDSKGVENEGAGAAAAMTAVNPVDPVDQSNDAFSRMIHATNLSDLESGFSDLMKSDGLEPDFWTTFFVERKQKLGVLGTSDELIALLKANPEWIYPIISLLRSAVSSNDTETANLLIDQIMARKTKENSAIILPSVMSAYYKLFSPERALNFYVEQVKSGIASSEKAALLSSMSASFDKKIDRFSYRAFSEMALLADAGRKSTSFDLAYNYGEDAKSWAISYETYAGIDTKNDNYIWTLNNRGVLLQDMDKAASISLYEHGFANGNAQSTSNLAAMLIADGYISAGERLLDGIVDQQQAAEHITSTRASALSAKREMEERFAEIVALARNETQRYRSVIGRALRWLETSSQTPRGVFSSKDQSFLVLLDASGAGCRLKIGTINYEGVLSNFLVGFDGTLSTNGQSVLGTSSLSVSLFIVGSTEMVAVIWPNNKSKTDRFRFVDLHMTDNGRRPEIDAPATPQLSN